MKKMNFLLFPALGILPFAAASCTTQQSDDKKERVLKFYVEPAGTNFEELKEDLEKQFEPTGLRMNFQELKGAPALQAVLKNEGQFAISSISAFQSLDDSLKSQLKIILSTKTRAFKYDKDYAEYSDGSSTDKLVEIATKTNEEFHKKPYSQWAKENWDGATYSNFYTDAEVTYQRGMILISADDELKVKITKAWNDKDWSKFRSYGIVHGDADSGSKYTLPEKLLKKHFNKEGDKFTTLALEIQNHPELFVSGKPDKLNEEGTRFNIAFDNQNSFAWTQSKEKYFKRYQNANNQNLNILVVTEAIPYNIVAARKDIDSDTLNRIVQKFTTMNDKYSRYVGFSGYQAVTDNGLSIQEKYDKATK
ncbi:ABC transporter thiamine pyrophosphate-binding lipoprotein p37/Cypl [Mycoplasma sp. Ms02]|uniref:ABC transporter thiamine pyrophosphate-binding lipoprotein p37/Cypl n=1 Tax=Mycoplasma sp. Ms02 TaxID=353851 RepID=UPI001C8A8980|nr:hypothetical protein [Mycoplasma sp. Ms02]QZE12290.1 hypothetical protein K4L35_03070 [Mycoplasma sp. Ms02]